MAIVTMLSIDGGGIRGLIPARLIAELELRSGHRAAELFDLVAGTSTGGILALGLARPDQHGSTLPRFTGSDLVDLYRQDGPKIFSRSLAHAVTTLWSLAGPKYSGVELERMLRQSFADYRLHEALTRVLVTTYDTEGPAPVIFKSWRAIDPQPGMPDAANNARDFEMWQVARATAAAPTYFPPFRLDPIASGGKPMTLVDGSVYAANPAMAGLADLHQLFPVADLYVVSLGTGNFLSRMPYRKVKGWGLAAWAVPIIQVMMDGMNDTVEYELDQFLPAAHPGIHHRFQTDLTGVSQRLDDASPENVRGLLALADRLVADHDAELTQVARELAAAIPDRPAPPTPRKVVRPVFNVRP